MFAEIWIKPLLGEAKPVRRTNRVLPEPRAQADARRNAAALDAEDDVVTTARSTPRRRPLRTAPQTGAQGSDGDGAETNVNGTGVVRQWMSEIASGARPVPQGGGTVRAPSESEIAILTGMFPEVDREVILGVLQRRCVRRLFDSGFISWVSPL